ncbi:hypothetical protein A2164_02125 [Candidatus Curtissbacteria bacterium RBG_13_35_7]|uniref:Uncharacterized protein n=1 Tax=Candidatus Curtissbacteria bacterium RBG_13_35_7 TaxID=1797705 RepID=A0A1F5G169_9BACT|nr:MAG: hypothetical protein A2164_02125 [Candidatus Curtissbacteria bacterium RBG_13_35_7]
MNQAEVVFWELKKDSVTWSSYLVDLKIIISNRVIDEFVAVLKDWKVIFESNPLEHLAMFITNACWLSLMISELVIY